MDLYLSILIFVGVAVAEFYVLSVRRMKLDPSALITLSLYFTVMLIRFLKQFIADNVDTPASIGISLSCHTLISMSMYFFVFEMQTVKDQLSAVTSLEFAKFQYRTRRNKTIVMILTLIYGVSYTVIRVLFAIHDQFTTV